MTAYNLSPSDCIESPKTGTTRRSNLPRAWDSMALQRDFRTWNVISVKWSHLPLLKLSGRNKWIFNKNEVILTLIHWLRPLFVCTCILWWSESALPNLSERIAKVPYHKITTSAWNEITMVILHFCWLSYLSSNCRCSIPATFIWNVIVTCHRHKMHMLYCASFTCMIYQFRDPLELNCCFDLNFLHTFRLTNRIWKSYKHASIDRAAEQAAMGKRVTVHSFTCGISRRYWYKNVHLGMKSTHEREDQSLI